MQARHQARYVCSALRLTFQWCRSNLLVPEHRRRSFLINLNRFTSEFLISCHCVAETLIHTTCYLYIVFKPSNQRRKHRWAAWYLNSGLSGPSQAAKVGRKSIFHVPRTLRMSWHRPVPWMPHVRLIFLECDFRVRASVHQCCK